MKPVLARTEQAWQKHQLEFAHVFIELRRVFPTMGGTIEEIAKMCFFAGADYENAYLNDLHRVNDRGAA